jgi:hypothetical protein
MLLSIYLLFVSRWDRPYILAKSSSKPEGSSHLLPLTDMTSMICSTILHVYFCLFSDFIATALLGSASAFAPSVAPRASAVQLGAKSASMPFLEQPPKVMVDQY